jgi:hypothetical protein
MLPLAGMYGIIVIGFYYRKISAEKMRREDASVIPQLYARIERGATRLTKLLGFTLCAAYLLAISINLNGIVAIDKEAQTRVTIGWGILCLIIACLMALTLNWVARSMYAGFDSKYKVNYSSEETYD